jgi:hypothetical protein
MKKIIIILFILFTSGYSDSTRIFQDQKDPPQPGIIRIIAGTFLIATAAVSLAGSIYEYNDYRNPNKDFGCTGRGSDQ